MEQCEFPKCRQPTEVGYIGRDVCSDHWRQLCDADSKTENRLLKKIGLVRNDNGAVVPITQEEKK